MDVSTRPSAHVKRSTWFLIGLYLGAALILLAVILLSLTINVSLDKFTRDPAVIMDFLPYIGFLSNFGVVLWVATAAICFFAGLVLRNISHKTKFSSFLLLSGLFTAVLAIDDLFLLHEAAESVADILEKLAFAIYGGMAIFGGVKFRQCILKTDYGLLLVALVFLGTSLLFDNFNFVQHLPTFGGWLKPVFIEDSLKFLGIVSWFAYFTSTSFTALTKAQNEKIASIY